MSDVSHMHRRHHEYTYRLPTPPRIIVPPPTLSAEVPDLHVSDTRSPEGDLDTSFLKEMDLAGIVQRNTLLEWQYERRQRAQMILPWLYLGPLAAAKDTNFLRNEGITMVLAIRSTETSMNRTLQLASEACREVSTIEARDYFTLIGKLSEATRRINQHIAKFRKYTAATGNPQLGKVLVFCESGNEKSAAVVAAYLMETLDNFDYIKSMQVCQAQRFCVNFDDALKNILRSHWEIIQARRSVANSHPEPAQTTPSNGSLQPLQPPANSQPHAFKPKRTIEETRDGEDVDMADGADPSDVLRFTGRDNTPFADP